MKALLVIFIAAAFLANAGCSQEKAIGDPPASAPVVPDVGVGRGGDSGTGSDVPGAPSNTSGSVGSGGTAEFDTTTLNMTAFRDFFFESSPNSPRNIRINIDLSRQRDTVIISYDDITATSPAKLGTLHPYSSVSDSSHNHWYTINGQPVWKGIFQDKAGAIVVVIDRFLSLGDGSLPAYVGGSVWFQNFERGYPYAPDQGSLKMCWQISLGPYDCRTNISGNSINLGLALYPTDRGPNKSLPYQKIGEFSGMSRTAAGF